MLHFFRKIRRDLIDNSQTFRYLKYAIGEIILVVLGILIAIQINNWNEKRETDLKKEVYIQRLLNDLRKDTVNFGSYVEICEKEIRLWRGIEKKIRKPNATLDSIIKIFTDTGRGGIPQLSAQNNTTYNSLLSTGDIELFQEDHMVMLMQYYDVMDGTYSFISLYQNIVSSNMRETFDEFGFLVMEKETSLIYKKLREELDEAKFLKMFLRDAHDNSFRMYYTKQYAYYGLVRTKEVIKAIKNPDEPNDLDIILPRY